MVITTITKPDQPLGNFLILHVLAQISMVHNQPNIIASMAGTIFKKQFSLVTPLERTHSAIESLLKTLSQSVLRLN